MKNIKFIVMQSGGVFSTLVVDLQGQRSTTLDKFNTTHCIDILYFLHLLHFFYSVGIELPAREYFHWFILDVSIHLNNTKSDTSQTNWGWKAVSMPFSAYCIYVRV